MNSTYFPHLSLKLSENVLCVSRRLLYEESAKERRRRRLAAAAASGAGSGSGGSVKGGGGGGKGSNKGKGKYANAGGGGGAALTDEEVKRKKKEEKDRRRSGLAAPDALYPSGEAFVEMVREVLALDMRTVRERRGARL